MTVYRYAATNLLTGQLLADTLPLSVDNFSAALNGGGTLTGKLNLQAAAQKNVPFVNALTCRKAVLWVLADQVPVWNGIIWDWPDESRAGGTLPISGQSMDFLWSKRLITSNLGYTGVDLFAVFIDLVQYGTTKKSAYITDGSGPASPLVAAAAAVAGLIVPSGAAAVSGISWTTSYAATDLGQVAQALADLVTSGNLEYAFVPGLDSSGNLATYLHLGFTQLGRSAPGYALTYPGNAIDYGYPVTGSQSANYIWATAPPNGATDQWESQYPHGADVADLQAGFPLLEDTVAWTNSVVTQQSQIDGYADGQVALVTQGMTTPVIKIGGGALPRLRDLVLGDTIPFAATSELHPATPGGQPGLQQNVRVSGWTCYPGDPDTPEYITIATSGVIAA